MPKNKRFLIHIMSRPQSILVAMRRHCALQDNSDRIGRPEYKNLKIRKEEEETTLYRYISATTVTCGCTLARAVQAGTRLYQSCNIEQVHFFSAGTFGLVVATREAADSSCKLLSVLGRCDGT